MQHRILEGKVRRRAVATLILFVLLIAVGSGAQASPRKTAAEPIVIGSTLSLTGAFASTGAIHKVAGELFVKNLNAGGGLLGRPVQWKVLDDQSDPAKVSALYEQLISQDHVDLIIGPYATPNIVAAQAVAERHGYVLVNHSAALTYALKYRCQFPTWTTGPHPNIGVPKLIFAALKSQKRPPKRIAFVTNAGGTTNYTSYGPPNSSEGGAVRLAKNLGFNVVLDLQHPPNVSDWGSIAAQVRAARPDLVWNDGLGLDPVNLLQAMVQLGFKPPQMFTLFPAPGPLLGMGRASENVLSLSIFEPNGRLLKRLGKKAQSIVAQFGAAAAAAHLSYRVLDSQAASSWTSWEVLTAGVRAAKSLDNGKICGALHQAPVPTTFLGSLKFDEKSNNFPPAHASVKQIQNGRWAVVWPPTLRTARLLAPGGTKK